MSITNHYIRELFDDDSLSNREDFMYKDDTLTFYTVCFVCEELYKVGAVILDSVEGSKINITLFRKKDRHECQTKSKNLKF